MILQESNRRRMWSFRRKTAEPPVNPKKRMSSGELRRFLQKKTPADAARWINSHGVKDYNMQPVPVPGEKRGSGDDAAA